MEQKKDNLLFETDFLKLDYDFVEYYVGMAKMVVYWHVKALGFKVIAYCGPETGYPHKCSYYITKGKIKLVITAASQPSSYEIVSFVDLHGNGTKRIGIKVDNVPAFFNEALNKGAIPSQSPYTLTDSKGDVECASFKLFDDNEIFIIDYKNYHGDFIPGYEINLWENYINKIFNSNTVGSFDEREETKEKQIGMLLKVLQTENKKLNNVLVEPDPKKNSQVQLFIDQNYGSGIQHIAFSSKNIFKSVEIMRKNGVNFSKFPDSYYKNLSKKYPKLDVDKLQKYGVLCDVVEDSLLLQIFTLPIGDRSTLFYEVVQRVNDYNGFGLDSIRALFDSIEEELMVTK